MNYIAKDDGEITLTNYDKFRQFARKTPEFLTTHI